MTRQTTGATMTALADRARQLARQHPPRTPERRAAAVVYVALTTTRTTDAARRALGTFGGPRLPDVRLTRKPRMADFARIASHAGPGSAPSSRS